MHMDTHTRNSANVGRKRGRRKNVGTAEGEEGASSRRRGGRGVGVTGAREGRECRGENM